jgi:hypothetical protein
MLLFLRRIIEWTRIVGREMSWAERIGPFHAWEIACTIHNKRDDRIRQNLERNI